MHRRRLVSLSIHEKKKEKAPCFKEDNMAKPFLQLLIENIFKPV